MPRPFGSVVELPDKLRAELQALVRAGSTPQALVFRCRIVLSAAEPDNPSNQDIAGKLGCNRHTVGRWRERFVANGLEGLQDAPRSGRPRSFSPPPSNGSPSSPSPPARPRSTTVRLMAGPSTRLLPPSSTKPTPKPSVGPPSSASSRRRI
jgi:hypothetical protein